MGPLIDWSTVPAEDAGGGITRQTVHGDRSTTIRYVYPPGSVFAAHHHPEEQLTTVLAGRITFWLGDQELTVGPGDSLLIPPNAPHGARVDGEASVETINVLAPRRQLSPTAR